MGIEEVRQKLTHSALDTLAISAKVARSHGGIIVPQDIAATLAAHTFREAFGDRSHSRRAVEAFIDWARYEARIPGNHLSETYGIMYGTEIRLSSETNILLARAHHFAKIDDKPKVGDLHILVAILGANGGESVEPLSFMTGDTTSAILYRQRILSRATGMQQNGYGASDEHALAQETIAQNLELKRAA